MRLTTCVFKTFFCCVCVWYMHECVHAHMLCTCGVCICRRWNPGLQAESWVQQTEPHPQPSLIPFLNSCSSHSLLGSGHWTLRSPRPLMIKYLVQYLLHPVASSSSEGFGSQDAGRQMGAQALSLLSRLHVWSTDSAQGQCLLWLPPICDFALGTSGVPYPVRGRIKDTQPQWAFEYTTKNSSKSLPKGQAPMWQPTQKQKVGTVRVIPCAPHRDTACHMRARIYFCVGNPKILLFLEGAQTGLKSDVPCFQGTVQAKQWNCVSVKLPFQPFPPGTPILPKEESTSCLLASMWRCPLFVLPWKKDPKSFLYRVKLNRPPAPHHLRSLSWVYESS